MSLRNDMAGGWSAKPATSVVRRAGSDGDDWLFVACNKSSDIVEIDGVLALVRRDPAGDGVNPW